MGKIRWATLVALIAVTALVGASAALAGDGNSVNTPLCQKDGWQVVLRADGTSFASEEACTSYVAQGGTLTGDVWWRWDAECLSNGATPHHDFPPEFPDFASCDFWPDGEARVEPTNALIKAFEDACGAAVSNLGYAGYQRHIFTVGLGPPTNGSRNHRLFVIGAICIPI